MCACLRMSVHNYVGRIRRWGTGENERDRKRERMGDNAREIMQGSDG